MGAILCHSTSSRFRSVTSFRLLVLAASIASTVFAEEVQSPNESESMPLSSVIQIIEQNEEKVQSVRFHVDVVDSTFELTDHGWIETEADESSTAAPSVVEAPGFRRVHADVVFDPRNLRYYVRLSSQRRVLLVPLGGDSAEVMHYSDLVEEFAGDRTTFQKKHTGYITTTKPDWDTPAQQWADVRPYKPEGVIDLPENAGHHFSDNKEFIAEHGYQVGIGWVTPYVSSQYEVPCRLSDLVKQKLLAKDHVAARLGDGGIIEVFYSTVDSFTPNYMLRIYYDAQRGRVAKCEWGGCRKCEVLDFADWKPNEVAEYKYPADDSLIPESVAVVQFRPETEEAFPEGTVRQGQIWKFTQSELNPPLSDSTFKLEFEEGTDVIDYVHQRKYVVGQGLEADELATREFLNHQGLIKDEEGVPESPRRSILWLSLGTAVLGAACLLIWRLRFRTQSNLIVLLLGAVASSSTFAVETERAGEANDAIEARHCGQLVSVAALHTYGIEYDLDIIREELPPGTRGIALSRIKRLLEAYGLQAQGRKGVTIDDLRKYITPHTSAIVPVRTSLGIDHYLFVLRKSYSSPILLIDPPRSATELSDRFGDILGDMGGIALFVSRRKSDGQTHTELKLEPQVVDLGEIDLSDSTKQFSFAHFKISNRGSVPAIVSRIVAGCGCIQVEQQPMILDVDEERAIEVRINNRGWGKGQIRRRLIVESNGQKATEAEIVGTGTTPYSNARLSISPDKVSFTVSAEQWLSREKHSELSGERIVIRGREDVLAGVSVMGADAWLSVSRGELQNGVIIVTPQLLIESTLRTSLHKSDAQAASEYLLSIGEETITIPVTVTRESLVVFAEPLFKAGSEDAAVTLRLRSRVNNGSGLLADKGVQLFQSGVANPLQCRTELSGEAIDISLPFPQLGFQRHAVLRAEVETPVGVEIASATLVKK